MPPAAPATKLIWKSIPSIDYYEVSNTGLVRSVSRLTTNGYFTKGKILKSQIQANGYEALTLSIDGGKRKLLIHRAVAEAFIPNPENKPVVNHKNFNRANNSVNNLEWCTQSENLMHASRGNRLLRGEKNTIAKLTEEQVLEIRAKYVPWIYPERKLAREYGVNKATMHSIVSGKTWKHLINREFQNASC